LFSSGAPDSSTNKTDSHDIAGIVVKAALNNINHKSHMWKSLARLTASFHSKGRFSPIKLV
jgi:hypothetical protein